jgi:tRNA A37 threonylcarbamoyladenosine synthetase subunit TsaC/SUA5/YrdC
LNLLKLFKTGEIGPDPLSKVKVSVLLALKKRFVHQKRILHVRKPAKLALLFFKSSVQNTDQKSFGPI